MNLQANVIFILTGILMLGAGPAFSQDDAVYVAPSGNVGLGLDTPERQLHLSGGNAVFRMDRSTDTAAFLMVRTSAQGAPLKSFVVGTNASGVNNGEFIINDLASAVSGAGTRRMTITNNGSVIFNGSVQAASFVTPSSRHLKENIQPIRDSLALTQSLEGVRFDWKDGGPAALGFIAEDVAGVLPEAVRRDQQSGQALGVDYSAIVPVLVEAVKEQQRQLETYRGLLIEQRAMLASLQTRLGEINSVRGEPATLKEWRAELLDSP